MRLVAARLHCYRRFQDERVDLDEEVIAIVGPNEAGKTSLLEALASIETDSEYGSDDLSKALKVSHGDPVVTVLYELEEFEAKIAEANGGLGKPKKYYVEKYRNGRIRSWVEPDVARNPRHRKSVLDRIEEIVEGQRLKPIFDTAVTLEDSPEGSTSTINVLGLLNQVENGLMGAGETLPSAQIEQIQECINCLRVFEEKVEEPKRRSIEITRSDLERLEEFEKKPHPQDLLLRQLSNWRPKFVLFKDRERHLKSRYAVSELENEPNPPLDNLLQLADLKISEVKNAMVSGNDPERASIQEQANEALAAEFKEAWGQSDVTVHLQIDPDEVHVHVKGGESILRLDVRSDGLKAFVALYAFTATRLQAGSRPILLIDEAERHLHYDAQADLVKVFEHQDRVGKVIYTTHSAGCLPSDLGSGIRIVDPIVSNSHDTLRSELKNGFWTEGPGFSSLMLAMGASVMALAPTRFAVIAEGASDMLLYPRLMREATDAKKLPFQVAPGLANVSSEDFQLLDLEASRVAYLVDGDNGGDQKRRALADAGVSEEFIVQLSPGLTLEDLVNGEQLVRAINSELSLSGHGDQTIIAKDLGEVGRIRAMKRWCEDHGIQPPSKRRIATRLLRERTGGRLVEHEQVEELQRVTGQIEKILFPDQNDAFESK